MVNIGSISKKSGNDILINLNDGPKRFNQLLKLISPSEKKISTRTVADRLKELEENELISREIVKGRPPTTVYQLTEKGKKTVDLLMKLMKI
jgi:DNA-binding HxlR family transcriptional regulator